jgi:hypothetical protein
MHVLWPPLITSVAIRLVWLPILQFMCKVSLERLPVLCPSSEESQPHQSQRLVPPTVQV